MEIVRPSGDECLAEGHTVSVWWSQLEPRQFAFSLVLLSQLRTSACKETKAWFLLSGSSAGEGRVARVDKLLQCDTASPLSSDDSGRLSDGGGQQGQRVRCGGNAGKKASATGAGLEWWPKSS